MRKLLPLRPRIPRQRMIFPSISHRQQQIPLQHLHHPGRHALLFSTTHRPQARRSKDAPKKDMRITLLRYHLLHPLTLTPPPLRFSRLRALRHWTIHRAWNLYRAKQRRATELELERQYTSMRDACEALRLMGDNGMSAEQARDKGAREPRDLGRLYRTAMMKEGIWGGVPIEYARAQTEWPSREGWNHEWRR